LADSLIPILFMDCPHRHRVGGGFFGIGLASSTDNVVSRLDGVKY